MSTYTDRTTETVKVSEVSEHGTITTEEGWSFAPPVKLEQGREYTFEYLGPHTGLGAQIVGIRDKLSWLYRHSDQDLERQHQEYVDNRRREAEERLEAHRDEWSARASRLPGPLQARLGNFRDRGGHTFERDGWGYELVVCELAALYAESEGSEVTEADIEIEAYARRHGTSWNQHDYAQQLARLLRDDPEKVRVTISALTPITGDPYYEKDQ